MKTETMHTACDICGRLAPSNRCASEPHSYVVEKIIFSDLFGFGRIEASDFCAECHSIFEHASRAAMYVSRSVKMRTKK